MEESQRTELAKKLTDARLEASPIEQISKEFKDFSVEDAYKIQDMGSQHRFDKGESLRGYKMGLTSKAKREQMDLDSPLYGFLTNKMEISNEGNFSMEGMIHPKVEPEIAFLLKRDVNSPMSLEDAIDSCSAVYPALEVLDSRYTQFKYFSLEDVIADNASSSHFVLGPELKDFNKLDFENLKMEMFINGELSQVGSSKDISGNPFQSLVELSHLATSRGVSLKEGQIVLAGAATAAVMMESGMNCLLKVEGIGEVGFSIN